jgi:hypothetical protein
VDCGNFGELRTASCALLEGVGKGLVSQAVEADVRFVLFSTSSRDFSNVEAVGPLGGLDALTPWLVFDIFYWLFASFWYIFRLIFAMRLCHHTGSFLLIVVVLIADLPWVVLQVALALTVGAVCVLAVLGFLLWNLALWVGEYFCTALGRAKGFCVAAKGFVWRQRWCTPHAKCVCDSLGEVLGNACECVLCLCAVVCYCGFCFASVASFPVLPFLFCANLSSTVCPIFCGYVGRTGSVEAYIAYFFATRLCGDAFQRIIATLCNTVASPL